MRGVRQRCVFYVSGFDPKGSAHYHGLYRQEAAKQSRINGWEFNVGERKRLAEGNSFWTIDACQVSGVHVSTHYEFMRWDDVVRQNWPMRKWTLWRDVLTTTLFNLRHGSLWQMFKISWPPAVALFAPFVLLLFMMLVAPALAALLGIWFVLQLQWPWAAGLACSVALLSVLWITGRRAESRYSMYWLTRSFAFTAKQALCEVPELEVRLDAHASRLFERLREQMDDEILLVAHSSGAIMAVSILARVCALLKAQSATGLVQPRLSFMTLGQCIPMLARLPQAQQFRDELAKVGQADWIDWIDFSAPPDGCCFALSDPVAFLGVKTCKSPKLLSPKFAEMFDSAKYRVLRKDKFRMHFQYLMSHDCVVEYDFFLITAANQSLCDRFSHVASVSDYKDLSPLPSCRA